MPPGLLTLSPTTSPPPPQQCCLTLNSPHGASTHPACSQGPVLRSQSRPWKPGGHTQWYSPPPSYTHWPPFWQGDCMVQMCSSTERQGRLRDSPLHLAPRPAQAPPTALWTQLTLQTHPGWCSVVGKQHRVRNRQLLALATSVSQSDWASSTSPVGLSFLI